MSKKVSNRRVRTSKDNCSVCGPRESEWYRYLRGTYVFDVDLAREIVQDGRGPIDLSTSDLRYCVANSHIHKHHVPHVDLRFPGIMACVFFTNADGVEEQGHLLIDGNHRAAKSLRLGVPYRFYLLTEKESRRILIRAPRLKPRSARRNCRRAVAKPKARVAKRQRRGA
jgi:hypothetical protein